MNVLSAMEDSVFSIRAETKSGRRKVISFSSMMPLNVKRKSKINSPITETESVAARRMKDGISVMDEMVWKEPRSAPASGVTAQNKANKPKAPQTALWREMLYTSTIMRWLNSGTRLPVSMAS